MSVPHDPNPQPRPPDAPTPVAGPGRGARSPLALAGAAVVIAAVVVAVLRFGVAHPPQLPSLLDEGAPMVPAAVVWTSSTDDGACLEIVEPDGTRRQPRCDRDGGEVVAWDDDGVHVHAFGPTGESVTVIDPDSGAAVGHRPLTDPLGGPAGPGPEVDTRLVEGTLTVTLGQRVLWEVEVPEGYWLGGAARSPDEDWLAMIDSAGRLLVLPVDGSSAPWIWAEDVASWQVPVWQGTPVP